MNISACAPNRAYYYSLRYKSLNMLRTLASLRSIAFVLALGIIIPILLIFASFLQSEPKIWQHIVDTLLVDLLKNTLMLCIGVLAGTFVLGVGAAWLTAVCDFPGRKFFNWALILPLAVPTYVLAFVFIGLLDFSGPVQALLRANIVSSLKWFPNIRSPGGVIVVMSLALYPYVYLLTRNAFKTQGKRVLEVSQALGHSRAKAFFKAALPMARPWIASGLMLVLMETLADFGAVSIFNYDTFTTGIYKAWFGFFSLSAAGQLSSVLLIFVFVVIIVEQQMRTKIQFNQVGKMTTEESRIRLNGWGKWIAFGFLSAILLIAFCIPCLQLLIWFVRSISAELDSRYIGLLFRSIFFSSISAAVIVGLGLFLAYIQRQYSDFTSKWIIRLATMGYALPGTVLAVGVVIMLSFADRQIIWLIKETSGIQLYSILNGTIVAVIFAYTVRFLTAGFNSINSSMLRITRSQDEASTLLGITGLNQLRKIHIPILKNGLFTAAMLVFVDVMKEMPITLMTRPFGWDTLAVKIFELTSEGEWQRAALPSITLVLAGLVPLILLNRQSERTTL
ncbi:MAG: iron ABC transporter permease [Desulfobacterales bacterium]|nr:MAG: iron ABC transporter permease [Desulfobacterales bacterium]